MKGPAAVAASYAADATAQLHHRPRASVSPKLPRRGPSPLSGSGMWQRRQEANVGQSSPRSAATLSGLAAEVGDGSGPLWRGGGNGHTTNAMAPALGLSQNSGSTATAATRTTAAGGEEGRCSSSSCGVYSLVDIRSAGRGAAGGSLGLGSPPTGVLLFREEPDGFSPPRPRAFWREEWYGACGGGRGGGGNCGTTQSRRQPLPEWECGACESGTTRQCLGNHSSSLVCRGSPSSHVATGEAQHVRHATVEGTLERRVGVAHCRRCCSNRSSFIDRRGVVSDASDREEKSGVATARPDELTSFSSGSGGVDQGEPKRAVHRKDDHEEGTKCAGAAVGGESSSSRGGITAAGLSLLAVVAVAAFAAGTMVGPPHRHHPPPPPPPPSALPTEYTSPVPLPSTYEPTLQEMMRAKKRRQAATPAADDIGHTQTSAARDVSGAVDGSRNGAESSEAVRTTAGGARVGSNATASTTGGAAASGAGNIPGDTQPQRNGSGPTNEVVVEGLVPEVAGCGGGDGGCMTLDAAAEDAAAGATVGKRGPSKNYCTQQAAAAAAFSTELGHQEPGTSNKGVPPAAVGDGWKIGELASEMAVGPAPSRSGLERHRRGVSDSRGVHSATLDSPRPLTMSRAASSSASSKTAATAAAAIAAGTTVVSGQKQRWRRRRQLERSSPLLTTPAAFAKTLGSAESSLAVCAGSGNDEQAIALRAAMSEKAARSACRSLAWSKAGSALGGGRRSDDENCDTDAAWVGVQGGGILLVAPLPPSMGTKWGSSSGGGGGSAARREAEMADEAAEDVSDAPTLGGRTRDEEIGRDGERLLDADLGGRPSPLASMVAATAAATMDEAPREAGGQEVPRSSSSSSSSHRLGASTGGGNQAAPRFRCRELVLSGKDVHDSWAGRYVLVEADVEDDVNVNSHYDTNAADRQKASEADGASLSPHVAAPYYCLETSLPPDDGAAAAVASFRARPPREGQIDERREGPPMSPRHAVYGNEDRCPAGAGAACPSESGLTAADGEDAPATSPTTVTPEPVVPQATAAGTAAAPAAATAAMEIGFDPDFPAATATPTTASAAADEPIDQLGLSEAWEGGTLCLYWADLGDNGGRWVLDDDLSLATGVLAVTKGPAPAAPDLAFANHGRRRQRAWERGDGWMALSEDASAAVGGMEGSGARDTSVAFEVEGGAQGDRFGLRVLGGGPGNGHTGVIGSTAGDGVANSEVAGVAAAGPPVPFPRSASVSGTKVHPGWLLDSPRVQGWVEADEMFVLCETD